MREVAMSRRAMYFSALLLAIALLLSGCAGPNPLAGTPGSHGVAGFLAGFWHGLILVIAFIISIFNHHVHIYEVHNNGLFYNLGFLLGAMISLGGSGRGSARR
jgi:hypothetical protein